MPDAPKKRAFGSAQAKPELSDLRWAAVKAVHQYLENKPPRDAQEICAQISVVKGLFNRIHRQDQGDWSTVYSVMGYPSSEQAGRIGQQLGRLRGALLRGSDEEADDAHGELLREGAPSFLGFYLDLDDRPFADADGYVYILSSRECPDFLKVGVTRRSVEEVAEEVNSGAGMTTPLGVRQVWAVPDAAKAEALVRAALEEYAVRRNIDLYCLSFPKAAAIITQALKYQE